MAYVLRFAAYVELDSAFVRCEPAPAGPDRSRISGDGLTPFEGWFQLKKVFPKNFHEEKCAVTCSRCYSTVYVQGTATDKVVQF